MFFSLSKIFWMVFQPLTAFSLLMVAGLAGFKSRVGKILLSISVTFFLICGFLPVGTNFLVYLENTYDAPQILPQDLDGIIVLGGSIESRLSYARGQPHLNDHAERITEMMKLSRLYPQTKIVFTGGDGTFAQNSGKESDVLFTLLKNIGFDTSRIIFEKDSRNTYENMIYSKALLHPQAGEKWVLVTSAFHIPRSVAVFQSGGWNVIPYPAGYLTDGKYTLFPDFDVLGNYYKLQVAVREIVGIIAYSLTERIKPYDEDSTDLPSPDRPTDISGTSRKL